MTKNFNDGKLGVKRFKLDSVRLGCSVGNYKLIREGPSSKIVDVIAVPNTSIFAQICCLIRASECRMVLQMVQLKRNSSVPGIISNWLRRALLATGYVMRNGQNNRAFSTGVHNNV